MVVEMKELVEKIAAQCIVPFPIALRGPELDKEKFADLLLKEVLKEVQQVWYELNNAPIPEGETLRDIGIRIGQKGGVMKVAQHLRKHFDIT
jgi:hypothetical protein